MVSNTLRNKKAGFTLTELLVVITTIMVLLLIGMMSYRVQLFKGYDARRKTDLHQIKIGLEEYEKDHDCYPDPPLGCGVGTGTALDPYMGEHVPCDPGTGQAYEYHPEGVACPGWFWVFTDLDYEEDPAIAELGCGAGCGYQDSGPFYNYYAFSPNAPDVYLAPFTKYGCFDSGGSQSCVGIADPPPCEPNYNTLAICESLCPGSLCQLP